MNINKTIIAISVLCLITSCSENKQKSREDAISEFRQGLTSQDTTAMLSLCDEAMEQLKNKNIDKVLAGLCEYDDSTKQVSPLSESTRKRYLHMFSTFPVLDYTRQYYSFMLEGCNDVKYEVTFASAEQIGSDKPATTMYMFNPVRVNGEWKLCVKAADNAFDQDYQ